MNNFFSGFRQNIMQQLNPFGQILSNRQNPMQVMTGTNANALPEMNIEQFKKMIPKITDTNLSQIADMARKAGMNEAQINQGIEFLKGMR